MRKIAVTSMANTNGKVRFTDTTASVLLDLVRGLAALLVLSVHLRNMLFVDYPEAIRRGASKILVTVPYVITSGGHQAVVLFFVLSGYLVGGSVLRLLSEGELRWKRYLTHRIVRLWIVLIPGLLLCFFWDSIGLRTHSLLYHGVIPNYETGDITRLQTTQSFFGNLFFLHPMLVPIYGSDGSLWSLSNEFWYYLLFPLGLVIFRREFAWKARCGCAVGFLASAWFVRASILPMFPVWLLGTLLTLVPTPRLSAFTRWVAALIYVPLIFTFSRLDRWPLLVEDYAFASLTTFFLWIMLSAKSRANKSAYWNRGSRGLARFSYTLYVVHQPVLLLLISSVISNQRMFPNAKSIVIGIGLFLITLGYAYGVATITEFRTDMVRRWIELRLGISSP